MNRCRPEPQSGILTALLEVAAFDGFMPGGSYAFGDTHNSFH